MNQQFVEHLIELRNHYRLQQLESEQRRHHVTQQLTHVDALLVDQLESSNLLESLIELRHQYQQQMAECDRSCAHCKEQLIHVNALLADQIVEQHQYPTLRATVEQRSSASAMALSRTLAPKLADEELPKEGELEKGWEEQVPPPSDETLNEAANSFQTAATEQLATDSEPTETETNSSELEPLGKLSEPSLAKEIFVAATETDDEDLSQWDIDPDDLDDDDFSQWDIDPYTSHGDIDFDTLTKKIFVAATVPVASSRLDEQPRETPLLPQYQDLTKSEALQQLMEEKAGSALHIDWLLRELFGELAEGQIAVERKRLSQILTDGVEQGQWEKVAGAPECYTIDHKLVEPEPAKRTKKKQQVQVKSTSSRQPGLTVLPKYSGASLIDAVELILANQAEEELTIEQVTKAMYGELTGRKLSQAKEVVGGALWRGAAAGRWHHVAGQKGVYTLETGIIEPASGANDTVSGARETGEATLKFLPVYEGMSFIDAAGTVLREHLGKVMTPEQVARVLYGDELSGTRLSKARHKVNRVLWDGASRKKWRRLTGVMGRYILDQ